MRQVSMLALKDFDFAGRHYVAGEYFTSNVKEALAHRYRGRARLSPAPPTPVEPVEEPKKKRRYQRKDMQAAE